MWSIHLLLLLLFYFLFWGSEYVWHGIKSNKKKNNENDEKYKIMNIQHIWKVQFNLHLIFIFFPLLVKFFFLSSEFYLVRMYLFRKHTNVWKSQLFMMPEREIAAQPTTFWRWILLFGSVSSASFSSHLKSGFFLGTRTRKMWG